jgi:hypothetical protein
MDVEMSPAPGQPLPQWEPANDVERRLSVVLADQDFDEAMRILLESPLMLPGFDDEEHGDSDRPGQEDRPGQRVVVRDRAGVPYLLVFTSLEAMRRVVTAEGWRETSMDELARSWPELSPTTPMGLAVNPTTPIVLLVEPEHVPLMNMPLPDPRREFEPANNTEAALREALVRIDGELLLNVMVTARVIVGNDGLEFDGVPTIVVFTSQQRCDEYLTQASLSMTTLPMEMAALLPQWPGPEYQLAVNPGSPIAFVLSSSRISGLREYAEALVRERRGGATDGSGRAARDRSTTMLMPTPEVVLERPGRPDSTGHPERADPADHSSGPARQPTDEHTAAHRPVDQDDRDAPHQSAEPDERTLTDDDLPSVDLTTDGRIADLLRGWD